jgi:coenzyme F420-reducing hydrogenase alpha subunit
MRLDMRIDSITKSYAIRAVLVTFLLLSLSGRSFAALPEESQQLTQLLGEAREEAAELAKDADEMESLILNDVSWQTHAEMLDRVKDHVNKMASIVAKLSETRSSGSELQEQAVDRILPLLKELATNTTNAINYLNQNKSRPKTEPYTQYLKDNAETAHQLVSTVSSLLEYEKSMTRISKLKNKLQLSGQ